MIVYTDKHRIPFQIDDEDFEAVSRYCWHINLEGYPTTMNGSSRGGQRAIPMRLHVFLNGRAVNGLEWDHENRDKLDNRRSNLRLVTHSTNQRNKVKPVGFGVIKRGNRWYAQIYVNRKRRHLGTYDTPEAAREARTKAELAFWGERSVTIPQAMNLNF